MTAEAFLRALRAFNRRRPFLPYVVELVSGSIIDVSHPEALSIEYTVVVYTAPDGSKRLLDCSTVCQFYDESRRELLPGSQG
jgi:hypothetical protein